MHLQLPLCVCLLACFQAARADEVIYGHEDESRNLLKDKNWDFEEEISSSNWGVRGAQSELISEDCNTGKSCLRVYNRPGKDNGLYIRVSGLKQSTSYYFSLFIKQLTNRTDGGSYSRIRTLGRYVPVTGKPSNFNLGRLPYMTADNVWRQIGADFITPDLEVKFYDFWVRGEPSDIEYAADTGALTEIPAYKDFVAETNAKIDLYRKTNLTLVGKIPEGASVVLQMKRHEFGFGTAIKGRAFTGSNTMDTAYKKFILKNFNWAVFENDMKWKPMEKRKGAVNFGTVDRAIAILQANDFKIRGHAISWDLMESNPFWVTKAAGLKLMQELFRRIRYVVDHYKQNITEWDVCNEYLHTHFFEDRTGILDLIEQEFREVMKIDSDTKLFLNDYQIARDGQYASAQAMLAKYLLSRGTPVHGIGIQSHLRHLPITPERLAKRVQIAGSVGLPITITEFSVHNKDVEVRAEAVEQAFRVYFADPNVHAIVLWGFADQYSPFANDYCLTEGPTFKPNKAGEVLLKLFRKWRTFKKLRTTDGNINSSFRAFYGEYDLSVWKDNKVISRNRIKVSRNGDNVFHL